MAEDFYKILEIDKNATVDEIKKAYRKKAMEYHPDRNPGDTIAADKFKEVTEAYEVLSDLQKKAFYDQHGTVQNRFNRSSSPIHEHFEDVISEFFGGNNFRGRNIQVRIEIDLLEAKNGCKKNIKIKRRKRCKTCDGNGYTSFTTCSTCGGSGLRIQFTGAFQIQTTCQTCGGSGKITTVKCKDCLGNGFSLFNDESLEVDIPKGIENGMQLRVQGQGEESKNGSNNGDLIIFVLVKEHKYYKREDEDLLLDFPVSYTQLILGDKVIIPTIDDEKIELTIPKGTQSNTKFKIKNKGMTDVRSGEIGNLIVTVKVEVPKKIDDEYLKIIESLKEMENKFITPKREFFMKD